MNRRTVFSLLIAWLTWSGTATAGAGSDAAERLDRFRQLAASRLAAAELSGHATAAGTLSELYDLLDDEIVESLATGSFFASQAFLQDRLDAFNDTWGGAAFRIVSLPGSNLVVGTFQLSPTGSGNSVRIYGRNGGGAGLVLAIHREGVPRLQAMPATRTGDPQFLVAWVGPQSSGGNTGLRLELWRRQGETVRLAWSTDSQADGGLQVTRFSLGGGELSFRYEVRYPGWKPGCAGQTEQEDLYRYVAARETFVLVRRRVHNGWHREFHAGLARFLAALNGKDARTLAGLVSRDTLRATLPARLDAEPACDEADAPAPTSVSVAATEPGDRQPWTLVFRRTREGWRLAAAVPVEPLSARMIR